MWTKQISSDGRIFYYNASKNESVFQPPPDSIVHEAIGLKPAPKQIVDDDRIKINEDSTNFLATLASSIPLAPVSQPPISVSSNSTPIASAQGTKLDEMR